MGEIDLSTVLRPGLLEGVSILLAGVPAATSTPEASEAPGAFSGVASAVAEACAALGAGVQECALLAGGASEEDDAATESAVSAALAARGGLQMLVVDAGALFLGESESTDGRERDAADAAPLLDALEASWRVTRAVATAAFIPGEAGGRIVYLAPPGGPAGAPVRTQADAARAGLENLSRTLSIEWARYGITPVTIASGPRTTPGVLAGVVAYLASPAGAYFSGCQLDLRCIGQVV